jgi:hypothetical protein
LKTGKNGPKIQSRAKTGKIFKTGHLPGNRVILGTLLTANITIKNKKILDFKVHNHYHK